MIRTKVKEIKGLIYRGIKHTKRVLRIKATKSPLCTYRGIEHRPKPASKMKKSTFMYRGVEYTK